MPAPILLACPNCGETMRVVSHSSTAGRPRIVVSWACTALRGCEVAGDADILLVPASDDELVVQVKQRVAA